MVPSDAPGEVWKNYKEVIPVGDGACPAGRKGLPGGGRLRPPGRRRQNDCRLFGGPRTCPCRSTVEARTAAWIVGTLQSLGGRAGRRMANVGSILDDGCTMHDVLRPRFSREIGASDSRLASQLGHLAEWQRHPRRGRPGRHADSGSEVTGSFDPVLLGLHEM